MKTAIKLDQLIHQGEDWNFSFVLKNPDGTVIDLSGYSVFASFRAKLEKDPIINLFTTIDIPTARITCSLSASITSTLKLGRGIYDVVLIDPSTKPEVLMEGFVEVKYSPTLSPTPTLQNND